MTRSVHRLRLFVAAVLIAIMAILVQGIASTSHYDAADASWSHCHGSQSIHELSNPPSSWPGTRAAHTVAYYYGVSSQSFYTKSGWWDPTWDYYYSTQFFC